MSISYANCHEMNEAINKFCAAVDELSLYGDVTDLSFNFKPKAALEDDNGEPILFTFSDRRGHNE